MPVDLRKTPRDLEGIAKTVVANPTLGKRFLHSKILSPHRRAVQSKEAMASYVASGLRKGVSLGLGQIPVPVVGAVVDKAFGAACDAIRKKHLQHHVTYPANLDERVKFELKDIGGEVEDWDRYRWKISHAVEQYNKTTMEVQQGISSAPCDTWVRVWSKYYYLGSRIGKLRESVEAMRAILLEVDTWLDSVEQSYGNTQLQIKALYDKDIAQLKTMQVHDTCSDTKCMFKQGQWTSQKSVPTSEGALFLVKGASKVAEILLNDPISDAVDEATS